MKAMLYKVAEILFWIFMGICVCCLLFGCASMKESGWYEHDSHFASFEHLKFSAHGYKSPSSEDIAVCEAQVWWGIPVNIGGE